MSFAFQGVSNFGELVALPSRFKLRRGFVFGLPPCLPAGRFRGRPVPIQSVFAFFLLLLSFWVRVLNVLSAISLLLWVLGEGRCSVVLVGVCMFPLPL